MKKEIDTLSKQIMPENDTFWKNKLMELEKEHEQFVKAKIELRDLEKMLGGMKAKTRATRKV